MYVPKQYTIFVLPDRFAASRIFILQKIRSLIYTGINRYIP